jgi:hypothetical protein
MVSPWHTRELPSRLSLQWALTLPVAGAQYTLLPIGVGEPRPLDIPVEKKFVSPRSFLDSNRLLVNSTRQGGQVRAYEYVLDSKTSRPLTPEGTRGLLVSADNHTLLTEDADGQWLLRALDVEVGPPLSRRMVTPTHIPCCAKPRPWARRELSASARSGAEKDYPNGHALSDRIAGRPRSRQVIGWPKRPSEKNPAQFACGPTRRHVRQPRYRDCCSVSANVFG